MSDKHPNHKGIVESYSLEDAIRLFSAGKTIELEGQRMVHYFEHISGEACDTLLLLHGFFYHTMTWNRLLPFLMDSLNIYALDMFQFGYSSRLEEISLDDYLYQLDQFIEAKGLQQVDLCGHCFGGAIAACFAARYPEKVKRLILIDSAGMEAKKGIIHLMKNRIIGKAFLAYHFSKEFLKEALLKEVFWNRFAQEFIDQNYIDQLYQPLSINGSINGLISAAKLHKTLNDGLIIDDIKNIPQQTLLIWGMHDNIWTPQIGRRLGGLISNSFIELIEGSGHHPHEEEPEIVSKHIRRFLQTPAKSPSLGEAQQGDRLLM